jgi:hypothetical protein
MIVNLDTFKQESNNLTIPGIVILNIPVPILQNDES